VHQRPSILLSGLSRTGKTGLARNLAARFGFRHVELDHCVQRMYAIRQAAARQEFRDGFYAHLLDGARTGYVLEGDDLLLLDRWHRSGRFGQEPLEPARLAEWSLRYGMVAVVIGVADSPLETLLEAVERDRGWVSEMSGSYRREYAEFLQTGSRRLRDLVTGGPVHYLEVDPANRAASLSACADRVMQLLP
jgi:hypothetical protein